MQSPAFGSGAMTAIRGTGQASSACHAWSPSSYPIWSGAGGTPRSGESVHEDLDVGCEQVVHPGPLRVDRVAERAPTVPRSAGTAPPR